MIEKGHEHVIACTSRGADLVTLRPCEYHAARAFLKVCATNQPCTKTYGTIIKPRDAREIARWLNAWADQEEQPEPKHSGGAVIGGVSAGVVALFLLGWLVRVVG